MYREGLLLHDTSLPLLLEEVLDKWNPACASLSLHPRGTLTFPNVVTVGPQRQGRIPQLWHEWLGEAGEENVCESNYKWFPY